MAKKLPDGNPEILKLKANEPTLLFALQDLIKNGGVDFDEWWKEWESGFIGREQILTNYKLTEWRKAGEFPRYVDITPKNSKSGCMTIEYFKNKKDKKNSIILSGTPAQLVQHIIQLEYEGSGSASGVFSGKNSKPPLKGFPAIELYFQQRNDDLKRKPDGSYYAPIEGTKIIRCVGFTDNESVANQTTAELIKSTDVKRWAQAIVDNFATPSLYQWNKGKKCLSYSGLTARLQGVEGYAYVRTEKDGIDLFTKLLAILGWKPDILGFNMSESTQPTAKYPDTSSKRRLLQQEWETDRVRPIATVVFDKATLNLPSVSKPIPLVKGSVVIYKD